MSQSRLSVHKIREVLRLHDEDISLSNRAIARACNIAASTVGEYLHRAKDAGLAWPLPEDLTEEELFDRISPEVCQRAMDPIPDWSYVLRELKRRGVTLKLLWREYREAHPKGYGYSQFCELYRGWSHGLEISMRIPHRGGEEMELDYAGTTIAIVDPKTGEITRGYLFVAVLPASGYFYVEVQPDCTMPHWIGGNVRALEFFGGLPRVLIPDNLKTGVKRPEFYEPDINPKFQHFAEHYGLVVLPTRIRHPQDKAHVENWAILDLSQSDPLGLFRCGHMAFPPTSITRGRVLETVLRYCIHGVLRSSEKVYIIKKWRYQTMRLS